MIWEERWEEKKHVNPREFPKFMPWDEKYDLLTHMQILFCHDLLVLFFFLNESRIVDSILSRFSDTSTVIHLLWMNSWLFKNLFACSFCFACSLCPYISVGVCPSEGRIWLQEPDVGCAMSLCANTSSFMYWQMATPHINSGVPTCLIGKDLVYNICLFTFAFGMHF